jgi:hypothetical protein
VKSSRSDKPTAEDSEYCRRMGKPENPIYINLYFRVKTKYPVDIPLNQSIDDCL